MEPLPIADSDHLLTSADLAALVGVKTGTVHVWRHRGLLPEPDQRYGNVMLWRWGSLVDVEIVASRIAGRS